MAKYSFEFKKQIVEEYLNGQGGYKFLAEKYGIPNCSPIKLWVRLYKEFGDESLIRSKKK